MANPKFTFIKISALKYDLNRNPRLTSSYNEDSDKDFKDLVLSIETEGFRVDKPILVSKRANGECWIVQGHRRYFSAVVVNKRSNGEKCKEIPCLVEEGLTLDEENRRLIDHFLVKGLSDFEQYLAVKQLLLTGMGEMEVAQHIGKSRGFVQRRKWIVQAPAVVEAEWRKKAEGNEDHVPLTDPNLTELKKAKTRDQEAGVDNTDGGPAFKEAWSKILATGKVKEAEPKAKTRSYMLDYCSMVKDPLILDTIKWCAGEVGIDMGKVNEGIATMRAKAVAYDDLLNGEDKLSATG